MSMNNAARNREEVKQKIEQVHLRLEEIKKEKDKVTEELAKDLEGCINDVVRQLTEYLSSDDVKKRFTTWKAEEVPVRCRSWEKTPVQVTKLFSSRLQEVIKKWEEENKDFANAHDTVLKQVQQRLNSITLQLDELQRDVTVFVWGPTRQDDSLNRPSLWMFGEAALFGIFGLVTTIWQSLLPPVFDTPALLISLTDVGRLFIIAFDTLKYKLDETAFMTANSESYLYEASKEHVLRNFVKDKFSGSQNLLDEIKIRLPKLIVAEEKQYTRLEYDERSQVALREVYQPLM